MILDALADYLAANSTSLTVGVNLTKGFMPDSPSTIVSLYETGGISPLNAFSTGNGVRVYEQPSMQVIGRSTDYQTVRALMEEVFTLLDGIGNTNLPTSTGVRYGSIDAVQSPFDAGQDSNDRHKMSVNFNVLKSTG